MKMMVYVGENARVQKSWEIEISSLEELNSIMSQYEKEYEDALVSYLGGEISINFD